MPQQNYSVGRDLTLVIQTAAGALSTNGITKFRSKQETTDVRVKLLNGITDHLRFFDGWSGSLDIERRDSTWDDYFSQLEANYYAGINEQPCQIYETHQEPNGQVTQYRYDGVMLSYDDAGEWSSDQTVRTNIRFMASRRIKVA